jgi:5-hydroxyisourate hydrolase
VAQDANQPAPTISTHVLDTERGVPAVGVHVTLYRLAEDGRPVRLSQALTDSDGRVKDLLERPLAAGDYRVEFNLEHSEGIVSEPYFRRLAIDIRVTDVTRSHHVPLLLAPYSMTTYRGT